MKLFSWGANSHGQLGQGCTSETCCLPTEISTPGIDPASIISIVGGGGHTLILDSSGRAYASGWNNKGQLGLEEEATTFQPIESLSGHRIAQLACGWDSSTAVASNGYLLAWGSNNYSQLGISKQKVNCSKSPVIVPTTRVRQASLGLRHLALVTEDSKVFVAGSGSKGQLGIVDTNGRPFSELNCLTEVPGLLNILNVSSGQHHTVALSIDGKVYVWGSNKFGQLGLDPSAQSCVFVPQQICLSELNLKGYPSTVYTGWTHTVLGTDEGELINWGRNSYGQLGSIERKISESWKPCVVQGVERIKQIALGSEHNVVLTEGRQILCWGWNEHGNCGTGSLDDVTHPCVVQAQAEMIGSGACHSFAILDTFVK